MRRIRAIAVAVLFVCVLMPSLRAGDNLRIAVIPKGMTHVYWKSVEAGAQKAAAELGVDVVWKGPLKENDRAQQISIVEQFVNERIAGIVLAPLDYDALVRPVSTATSRNIPVVIMDSALKGEAGKDFVSFVATNNRKGGSLGAERLARLIGGKGKVVMLRYMVGSASTMEREEGFLETIAKHPGIQVTVSNRYAGATSGDAKTASMNMIDRIKQADGIFCSNESATFGMLLALRQSHYTRKVRFVGFDTSPQLIEGLEKGEIDALVAQNPTFMGYEAVKTLVNHLRGMKVDTNIDTGVEVVSQENLNTAAVKALLGR